MAIDTRGVVEGTRVNQRGGYTIGERATPERSAAYRRSNGYTRIA